MMQSNDHRSRSLPVPAPYKSELSPLWDGILAGFPAALCRLRATASYSFCGVPPPRDGLAFCSAKRLTTKGGVREKFLPYVSFSQLQPRWADKGGEALS